MTSLQFESQFAMENGQAVGAAAALSGGEGAGLIVRDTSVLSSAALLEGTAPERLVCLGPMALARWNAIGQSC